MDFMFYGLVNMAERFVESFCFWVWHEDSTDMPASMRAQIAARHQAEQKTI